MQDGTLVEETALMQEGALLQEGALMQGGTLHNDLDEFFSCAENSIMDFN